MIAACIQRLATSQQSRIQLVDALNGSTKHRLCDAIQFAIGGIQKNYPPLREDLGIQTSERRSQSFPRTIRFAQELRRLRIAKSHRAHRSACYIAAGRGKNLRTALSSRDSNVIYLRQIVVVRGQPENWDRIHSSRRGLLSKLDRGEGLVNGEHRAAEKSNLLSGDDRGCTFT